MSDRDPITEDEGMQLIAQILDELNVKRSSAIIEGDTTAGDKKYLLVEASLTSHDSLEEAAAAATLKNEGAPANEQLH